MPEKLVIEHSMRQIYELIGFDIGRPRGEGTSLVYLDETLDELPKKT